MIHPATAPRQRSALPADIAPESITAIIDTREQQPWDLSPLRMVRDTLKSGDVSIVGLTDEVALERKSLADFIACCGAERERFENELHRLRAYRCKAVVVEASLDDIERGDWRSQITPASVIGSVLGWLSDGIPFLFAGDRERAQRLAARLLYIYARRRYRELRAIAGAGIEAHEPEQVS